MEKNTDHEYWGDAYLDEVTFIDLGQDPAAWFAGAEADEFDMTYETVGEFVDLFAAIGWEQSEVVTAATVVIRPNQNNPPYDDPCVRRAIQLAVDPQVCLDLGINGQGITAENHHVCPIHPEYAELPPNTIDKDAAYAMLEESGARRPCVRDRPRSTTITAATPPMPSPRSCATRASTWNAW
jgi:peptide/nickel transport system substrate-binding protein